MPSGKRLLIARCDSDSGGAEDFYLLRRDAVSVGLIPDVS